MLHRKTFERTKNSRPSEHLEICNSLPVDNEHPTVSSAVSPFASNNISGALSLFAFLFVFGLLSLVFPWIISEFAQQAHRPANKQANKSNIMENLLRLTPVPSTSSSSSPSMRRSPTSWKLTNMAMMLAEQQADANELEHNNKSHNNSHSKPCSPMRKPPRHSSVPMCAQILLALWQRELQRTDVSITSDLFYDLDGSDEQAFFLVDRMQRMGFNITLTQFFSMQRCSIYSVLLVAL